MESDAITANGMMSFLKESLIERSDGPFAMIQETMSQTLEASVSALKA
jgi:hypothetical protein